MNLFFLTHALPLMVSSPSNTVDFQYGIVFVKTFEWNLAATLWKRKGSVSSLFTNERNLLLLPKPSEIHQATFVLLAQMHYFPYKLIPRLWYRHCVFAQICAVASKVAFCAVMVQKYNPLKGIARLPISSDDWRNRVITNCPKLWYAHCFFVWICAIAPNASFHHALHQSIARWDLV